MENNGDFHELVTYVNTPSSIDYMNGTIWSKNVTDKSDWTWTELQNLILTLDYVSLVEQMTHNWMLMLLDCQ